MKIAICDDEVHWVDVIKNKIENLHYGEMLDVKIDCFTNQEEFLAKAEKTNYHLVYLDIEMEGKNGIEVAQRLKEINNACIVIFVTAYNGYVHDAFRVDAFQYLTKPINDDLFAKEFERAINNYKKTNLIRIFKVREGKKAFNLSEIISVESYYNTTFIKTTRGTYITNYANLCIIREEIMDYDFIRIQAGLIANMNFVVSMKYREVELINGEVYPISISHYRKVMEKYHRFLSAQK